MDPKQEKATAAPIAASRSGAISSSRPRAIRRASIATDKETGKVVWETNCRDGQADVQLTAAPLAVKDKIIVGAAGGDRGVRDLIAGARCQDRQAALAQIRDPGARRARQRDLEGQGQVAWQTGGGAMWVTGTYDLATNQIIWGTGNPVPMFDADLSAGRQPLHQQRDLVESRQRQDELVLPVHARRHVGLRRGRHPHPDRRRRSTASRAS